MAIADGSFFQNPNLIAALNHVKHNRSSLHLLGLIGGGGVHSDLSHFFALLRLCHEQQITSVFLHLFTDGRDSPPSAAMTYISQLQSVMNREGTGTIATVMGRYYAMDRDFRWDRTSKAYACLTQGVGKTAPTIDAAVSQAYTASQTDEFIDPTIITNSANQPVGLVHDNDAVIFVNFRIDRPRQLTKAFVLDDFENTANTVGFDPYAVRYLKKHDVSLTASKQRPFTRPTKISNLFFVTITEYEKNLPVHVAFPPQVVENPLGRVISDHGLRQLRLAESEKERFVTYYFNGLREDPFQGEERAIIPSPKVATYDKKPQMSARELTDRALSEIRSGSYDFLVMNYANADMVGHTGNLKATIQACEVVDACLNDLTNTVVGAGGVVFITADHGNAEEMINQSTGQVDTEHNANPVPIIVCGNQFRTASQVPQGILADVAPTILTVLGIPIPITMTGRNLLSSVGLH
jgi:2,3-bisphosphoglycerate-independent phosphoglycerate mutase